MGDGCESEAVSRVHGCLKRRAPKSLQVKVGRSQFYILIAKHSKITPTPEPRAGFELERVWGYNVGAGPAAVHWSFDEYT